MLVNEPQLKDFTTGKSHTSEIALNRIIAQKGTESPLRFSEMKEKKMRNKDLSNFMEDYE